MGVNADNPWGWQCRRWEEKEREEWGNLETLLLGE